MRAAYSQSTGIVRTPTVQALQFNTRDNFNRRHISRPSCVSLRQLLLFCNLSALSTMNREISSQSAEISSLALEQLRVTCTRSQSRLCGVLVVLQSQGQGVTYNRNRNVESLVMPIMSSQQLPVTIVLCQRGYNYSVFSTIENSFPPISRKQRSWRSRNSTARRLYFTEQSPSTCLVELS